MKAAILIDGGFFLKRLGAVRSDVEGRDPVAVVRAIGELVKAHLTHLHRRYGGTTPEALLYRAFYYDAHPYMGQGQRPVSKRAIRYGKSPEATFRRSLFQLLRRRAAFAVHLGEVRRERAWVLKEGAQKALLTRTITVDDLTDDDFHAGLRQKAVDMRFALDISSITLKRQADLLVLVTGDSDFVPAAKLARRKGVKVVLDPLWQNVAEGLFEHIDAVRSGFARPVRSGAAS